MLKNWIWLSFVLACAVACMAQKDVSPLEGVWGVKKVLGPPVSGTLQITRGPSGWRAQIGPYDVQPTVEGKSIRFELPPEQGRFDGQFEKNDTVIRGWWIKPAVSPVQLQALTKDQWVGEVAPVQQEWTVYLVISRASDGSLAAFIRNPDRNQGVFWPIERVEHDGDRVRLFCKAPCQGNKEFDGHYDAER